MKDTSTFPAAPLSAQPPVGAHPSTQPQVALRQAYYALFVLWLAHLVANIDRFAFGIVLQKIKTDLVLTDAQVGMATGLAFVVAYLGFGVPVARWLDRANRRNILAGAVAVWSAMTVACGTATNFVQLALARAGLGAGEAPCIPASVSLIASYFPREKRTQAAGIFNSAAAAAGILGTPLMGYIADRYGWRMGFYVFGAIGLVLALVVRWSLREPARPAPAETNPAQVGLGQVLRAIWAQRAFRYTLLGHGLFGIGFFAFATWFAVVLVRSYGMSYTELGLYAGVVLGGTMLVSTVASGFFCPLVVRRTGNDRWMVYLPALFCLLSVPWMVVSSAGVPQWLAMAGGVGVFFFAMTRTPPLVSLTMDLLPPAMHGVATMVLVIFSNILGSALGPLITGRLSDALAPSLGSALALQQALLWTAPAFCLAGSLLAFWPARHVPRRIVPA